jgi:tRNA(fMet)-specific endonuclease VapC
LLTPEAVVLDTNVVSVFLKVSVVHERRRLAIESFVKDKIALISFVSVAEMLYWAESKNWGEKKRQDLDQRLRVYGILDPSRTTAELWAAKKRECTASGINVAPHDMWIAAAALEYDLTVLTDDGIFRRIPGLKVHSI